MIEGRKFLSYRLLSECVELGREFAKWMMARFALNFGSIVSYERLRIMSISWPG